MNNTCLVSIIIPTHNRSTLLKKCIDSVQRQTIDNIEIIVCDDGSTDDTKAVVQNIIKKDSRVKYIYCGQNGRPSIPRNMGMKISSGEWIAFVDDDDYWFDNKLELQIKYIKQYKCLACCTNATKYNLDNSNQNLFFELEDNLKIGFNDFLKDNKVICSSMIIHRSIYQQCGDFPLYEVEDYAYWFRISTITNILLLKEPLVYYLETSATSIRMQNVNSFYCQQNDIFDDLEKWNKKLSFKYKYQIRKRKIYNCLMITLINLKRKCLK